MSPDDHGIQIIEMMMAVVMGARHHLQEDAAVGCGAHISEAYHVMVIVCRLQRLCLTLLSLHDKGGLT